MRIRRRVARHRHQLQRSFARLWVGFTFSSSGDGLIYGAVPLMAVVVDPRPLAVSAVAAADSLPWLLLALPAGAFADRFDQGPMMALANTFRAAVILLAALLIMSDRMTLVILILVVLLNAGARAVYYSSFQAMVPALVDSDSLEHANGSLTGTESGAEHLAGPIVGTWLFAVSEAIPFLADAIALALSAFPFLKLRSREKPESEESPSIWEGAKLLFADRRLRILLAMVSCLAGLQGMEAGVLVLLATTEWGVRSGAYGIFLAVGALGNVFGSLVADRLVKRFGSAWTLICTAIASGGGYLIMASAQSWRLAGPAFFLVGLAVATGSVVATSLRQRLTPQSLMGRVGGAWRGITWGAAPVGAIAAGTLATIGGLRLPLVLAGILQCAVAFVLARPLLRSIRAGAGPSTETDEHVVTREENDPSHHAAGG
jgi:Na+/melibiose symporter-like transporter